MLPNFPKKQPQDVLKICKIKEHIEKVTLNVISSIELLRRQDAKDPQNPELLIRLQSESLTILMFATEPSI